jgi:hypothetical protein
MMKTNEVLSVLNSLINTPLEEWYSKGVSLKTASTNASGLVNSGIIKTNGMHFFRKHEYVNGAFTGKSVFVLS